MQKFKNASIVLGQRQRRGPHYPHLRQHPLIQLLPPLLPPLLPLAREGAADALGDGRDADAQADEREGADGGGAAPARGGLARGVALEEQLGDALQAGGALQPQDLGLGGFGPRREVKAAAAVAAAGSLGRQRRWCRCWGC